MQKRRTNKKATSGKSNYPKRDNHKENYVESRGRDTKVHGAENDINWYMQDSALVAAAGRLNFNNPLGVDVPNRDFYPETLAMLSGAGFTTNTLGVPIPAAIPGINALSCVPYYGVADDANDPINVAARAMFGRIRSTLSTSNLGVDASDMMVYLIAMDNAISFYGWMCRLYGLASNFGALNKYLGQGLIYANGVDYDDLVTNYGNLRYYIRLFATKFNTALHMPKGYGIVERHYWLFSNVFKDGEVEKAGIYMHVPQGFYFWNNYGSTGSAAEYNELMPMHAPADTFYGATSTLSGYTPLTVNMIIAYGDILLNRLLYDDDVANIAGLMLRTYGSDGCYKLVPMPDDYSVVPVYSKEILEQIHNTTFTGVNFASDGGWVANSGINYEQVVPTNSWEDPYLVSKPAWGSSSGSTSRRSQAATIGGALPKVLDSREEVPNEATVMLDSRNMAYTKVTMNYQGSISKVELLSAGLEVYSCMNLLALRMPLLPWTTLGYNEFINLVCCSSSMGNTDLGSLTNPDELLAMSWVAATTSLLSAFDWAPRVCFVGTFASTVTSNTACYGYLGDFYEYNNYTVIQPDVLNKLHEAALTGAFAVPIEARAWNK